MTASKACGDSGCSSASPHRWVTRSARPLRRVRSRPDAVQLGLQLERRDMAARRVSEEAGGATDARTDVEHATRWTEA